MHKFAARGEGRNGANANLIMQPSKVEIEQLSNNEGSSRFERRLMDHGGEAAGKKNQSFIPSGGGKVLTFLPCKCSEGRYLNDVRKIFGILDPLPPPLSRSANLRVKILHLLHLIQVTLVKELSINDVLV